MWKQILGCNLAHSPSHLKFWVFSVSSKVLSNRDVNIKQVSGIKSSKFNGFVLALVLALFLVLTWFRSKCDFRKLSTLLISCFLNKLTFLSQNWCFFQKVESLLEV